MDRLEKEVANYNQEPPHVSRPRPSDGLLLANQETMDAQGSTNWNGFDWSIVGEAGAGTLHPRLAWGMSGMMQSAFSVDNAQPHSSATSNPLFPLVRSSLGPQHLSHPLMPAYLEAYFTHVQPAFPFLDEESIRGSMNQVLTVNTVQDDIPTLTLVLALGAAILPGKSHVSAYHSIELFASACDGEIMKSTKTDLCSLQFGLLAVLFSLHHPSGGSSWHMIGLCVQMAVTLGLHHTKGLSSGNTLGQNAFWTSYVLDR